MAGERQVVGAGDLSQVPDRHVDRREQVDICGRLSEFTGSALENDDLAHGCTESTEVPDTTRGDAR